MKISLHVYLFIILLLTGLPYLSQIPSVQAGEETAISKGMAIALEADHRDQGYEDFTANLEMVLRNKQGQESKRRIRIRTLEVQGDGDKSLMIFDTPRDVKGTAFLTFSHKKGDDDQWLYLPALKRVKRISSRNKSGSFMGSEFTYEDIASQEVEKYTYKWLRDEQFDGHACFVNESYPVDKKNSGYTRQVAWRDKAEYRIRKVEYYDRKGTQIKTLTMSDFKKYAGKYWRPGLMKMINHQNGKSTDLIWTEYHLQVGLHDRDFSKNSLKRAK